MFVLILDSVDDFHTVEVRRLHRIFCGLLKLPDALEFDAVFSYSLSKRLTNRIRQ